MSLCGNNLIFFRIKYLLISNLSKNKLYMFLKMNQPYAFNQDQMNGIVEETYINIIKECEKLKNETHCPNEQLVALLSVIASNFAPILKNKNN